VRRAVAFLGVVRVEEQRVDGLVALEVDDAQHLPLGDARKPWFAGGDDRVAQGKRRIERALHDGRYARGRRGG